MLISFLYSSILVHCYLLWCVTSILHWCLWNCCMYIVTVCLTFILHSVLAFRSCCTHTFAICRNVCHINPWPSVHVQRSELSALQHRSFETTPWGKLSQGQTWLIPGTFPLFWDGNICYVAVGVLSIRETNCGRTSLTNSCRLQSAFPQLGRETDRKNADLNGLPVLSFFLRLFPLSLLGIPGNSKHVSVELDWENATA